MHVGSTAWLLLVLLFTFVTLMLQLAEPLALLPGRVPAWRLGCMLPDQRPAMRMYLVWVSTWSSSSMQCYIELPVKCLAY
jgi:hypothetical protein